MRKRIPGLAAWGSPASRSLIQRGVFPFSSQSTCAGSFAPSPRRVPAAMNHRHKVLVFQDGLAGHLSTTQASPSLLFQRSFPCRFSSSSSPPASDSAASSPARPSPPVSSPVSDLAESAGCSPTPSVDPPGASPVTSSSSSSSCSSSYPLGIKQTLPRKLIKPTRSSLAVAASPSSSSPPPSAGSSAGSELVVYERPGGSRWVRREQLSLYLAHAVGLGYFQALFEDSALEPAAVFDLLCDFVRRSAAERPAASDKADSHEHTPREGQESHADDKVTATELAELMRNCVSSRFRDVDILDVLADVLGSLVIGSADVPLLVDIANSCAALALLRPRLFAAISSRLTAVLPPLSPSPSSVSSACANLSPADAVCLLEAFSRQRFRDSDLLSLLLRPLSPCLPSLSPRLACRLLHALAGLGSDAATAETTEALLARISAGVALPGEEGKTKSGLDKRAASGEPNEALRLADLAKAVHALLLLEIELEQKPLLENLLAAMAPEIFERPVDFWARSPSAISLHKRLLLLRTALRHLHRETIYNGLQPSVRQAFRRLQRAEIVSTPRAPTYFVTRMSALLTRLRIAHFCYATRGPLVFDVLERDRPLVWQCNTVDRFYVNSAEKTSAAKLQERITKAMGLRVVNCEYWQWMKMKRKRTRLEYIRMQRYYTLKDRRQHDPDFEGWTLPLVHHMHRRNRLHYDYYFPNYTPLSRVEY
ncbi:RAP domain-containing protein [Besnoitia besnoiti]|uniref:RAP domain-containing protein n=1 Tax=Besnoitia besnoiti TaxID=94643 RepID=A0A2A9MKI4_BESBE|nr:RAP domain-containing protein [Besnoitia besnoiti]PFH36496.1 RAP domain-containing protein [Besnoitia besnoiti]